MGALWGEHSLKVARSARDVRAQCVRSAKTPPLHLIFLGLLFQGVPHLFRLISGGYSIFPFSELPHFPHFPLLVFNAAHVFFLFL